MQIGKLQLLCQPKSRRSLFLASLRLFDFEKFISNLKWEKNADLRKLQVKVKESPAKDQPTQREKVMEKIQRIYLLI